MFAVGDRIRYKPGIGTYGYEDVIEADGRLPGIVVGFSRTRVRVELQLAKRNNTTVRRAVDAASLEKQCDHKFIDSTTCVKCGWMPPANKAVAAS
jgi:hypothetical protein